MKHLYEEVAYLKGLAEGLEISAESKEGKMIHKIVDALEVFADAIVTLDEEQEELQDFVESIDEDLADLEEEIADMEDDLYEEDEEDDDEDFSYIEMECPNCGELVEIDEDLLYDDEVDVVCPDCKAVILSSEDDCDDDCTCGGCSSCDDRE